MSENKSKKKKSPTKRHQMVADAERVIIESVLPQIDSGIFPIKRIVGETIHVEACIYGDGHDDVSAALLYRKKEDQKWTELLLDKQPNDIWEGEFVASEKQDYVYTVCGWVDPFLTWQKKFKKLYAAEQDLQVELAIGAGYLEKASKKARGKDAVFLKNLARSFMDKEHYFYSCYMAQTDHLLDLMKRFGIRNCYQEYPKILQVRVDRKKALFSSWYEFFPRSWGEQPHQHGTLKSCQRILPEIARMGFDVVYLPPIHPIGKKNRKGKNNVTVAEENDPGSPWAIGSDKGGHKSIHPELGTVTDFKNFMKEAKKHDLEVAMDIAFQCSPDHPYVKEHPQWFKWRPDNTIQYAENPPKRYEDIYPIDFESKDWKNLWKELKSVFEYWIDKGVRIFRIDNPHTKPFAFWDWVIAEIRDQNQDVVFLAEAFTRPHVMKRLAKGGFQQSYTYFTWRTSAEDLKEYMHELTQTEVKEYFRPNFWPNTPDILPYHLQLGERSTFMARFVLAATLSSNYGIYGPAYELCESRAVPGKEEYARSEKYEIKAWDWDAPWNLKVFIARINAIRKNYEAFHQTNNYKHISLDNPALFAFVKTTQNHKADLLIVVNLDPYQKQAATLSVPVEELGIGYHRHYQVEDLLSGSEYTWYESSNYVELEPQHCPAHIFLIKS